MEEESFGEDKGNDTYGVQDESILYQTLEEHVVAVAEELHEYAYSSGNYDLFASLTFTDGSLLLYSPDYVKAVQRKTAWAPL